MMSSLCQALFYKIYSVIFQIALNPMIYMLVLFLFFT